MENNHLNYDIIRFDHKQRLTDRFLTSEIHHLSFQSRPIIFAIVVEIVNPWHPTSQLGQMILNNLIREFSRSQSNSLLGRFEQSLKFVNKYVEEVALKVHAPVSCAVALVENDQVHLASVGTGRLMLVRGDKLAFISNKSASKTFSSVTSGDLRDSDWLCLANNGFADFIAETLPLENWDTSPSEIERLVKETAATQEKLSWSGVLIRPRFEQQAEQRVVLWDEIEPVVPMKLPRIEWRAGSEKILTSLQSSLVATMSYLSSAKKLLPLEKVRLPKIRPFFVFAAVIVVLAIVWGINLSADRIKGSKEEAPVQTLLATVEAASAETRVPTFMREYTSEKFSALADSDKQKLVATLTSLGLTPKEPQLVSQLPSSIVAVDSFGADLAAVDSQGQVWVIKNGLSVQLEMTQKITNPLSIAAFSETMILVSDTSGNVWKLDGSASQPTALSLPSALATGTKLLENYQNNLYIYNIEAQTIYRLANFNGELNGAAIYTRSEILSDKDLTDWSINGQIITISSLGQIRDLVRNTNGDLQVSLPTHDGEVFRLAADAATPTINTANGRLIYYYDAEGELIQTVFALIAGKVGDISINSDSPSTLWLTRDQDILQLKI